jgi:hypothetical protein
MTVAFWNTLFEVLSIRLPAWIIVTGALVAGTPVAGTLVAGTLVAGTPVSAMTALVKKQWANVVNIKVDLNMLFFIFRRPVITHQG